MCISCINCISAFLFKLCQPILKKTECVFLDRAEIGRVLNKHLQIWITWNSPFRTKIYSRLHIYLRKIVHSNGLDSVLKNNSKDTPILLYKIHILKYNETICRDKPRLNLTHVWKHWQSSYRRMQTFPICKSVGLNRFLYNIVKLKKKKRKKKKWRGASYCYDQPSTLRYKFFSILKSR